MANFLKSKGFKYVKNLLIGVGASVVLVGALFKIQSRPGADEMLAIGMLVEAGLFLMLGLLGPEPDYYWEKLYPGLNEYNKDFNREEYGLSASSGGPSTPGLDGKVVESHLHGMLSELQTMSKSLSSLKALQDVDFSGTPDHIKAANTFFNKFNEAMVDLAETADGVKAYKDQLNTLNQNMTELNKKYASLNQIYGGVISAMTAGNRQA